ncbi:MAG: virulence factor family protein, partial [Modestobacter sp.]|nr:virulence factor family protein [Modestobacter sp.]
MTARRVLQGAAGAALLISVLTLLSRLTGFGRTLVFTNAVGAGST